MAHDPEATPPRGQTTSMRSLERAIDVLEVLDNSSQPLRLSEIAKRANLHIATTQRILSVLQARGRVERDDAGYRPGVSMLFGAHAYLLTSPLVTASRPVLQDLASQTTLTASLYVRSGWSRAVVSRVEGARPLRYVLPTGERLPLTLGGGKVLAAYLTREQQSGLLAAEEPIVTATGQKISKRQFLADMVKIRSQGYYHSHSERVVGIAFVAAPVMDRADNCVAGVQVAGTLADFPEDRVPEIALEVRRAAQAITDRIT